MGSKNKTHKTQRRKPNSIVNNLTLSCKYFFFCRILCYRCCLFGTVWVFVNEYRTGSVSSTGCPLISAPLYYYCPDSRRRHPEASSKTGKLRPSTSATPLPLETISEDSNCKPPDGEITELY